MMQERNAKILMMTFMTASIMILMSFLAAVLLSGSAEAVDIELFYGSGCPHCKNEIRFLKSLDDSLNITLNITYREIYNNGSNKLLFDQRVSEYNPDKIGVPTTVIGNRMIVGFSDDISMQITGLIMNESEREISEISRNCILNKSDESGHDDSRITMLLIICSVILTSVIIMTLSDSKKNRKKISEKRRNQKRNLEKN